MKKLNFNALSFFLTGSLFLASCGDDASPDRYALKNIFGKDDRVDMAAGVRPWSAIGRL
ncbi:MAG: hypothetical protein HQK54_16980, partial [Oligoflexales bacterium]|nr:hypothetical protein [Oligoflexales bacterium]